MHTKQNHIIIGLGGTGGKIIRSFRKTIFQEYRKTDPEELNIGYLYVDSDDGLMGLGDTSWKTLGTSVQLGTDSQVLIKGSDLRAKLNTIEQYPGIEPWIGDRSAWMEVLDGVLGDSVGGQRRRLGRFLFSCQVAHFRTALLGQQRKLEGKSGEKETTFHICAGLAGGTGSGCIADVVAQIREMFTPTVSTKYTIILYLFLPETHPKPNWDTGNYHANGFAALQELNALSVGSFQPIDIRGNNRQEDGKWTNRLRLDRPFNGSYLFTNENEKGKIVDTEKDVPQIVASFLYQKIVAYNFLELGANVANPNEIVKRAEDAENGDGTPEIDAGNVLGSRSKRFLTFGVKCVATPEEEIREFMTYSFARQAALQFRYNNWIDGVGYIDSARNKDFLSIVTDPATLEKWLLTNEHITLSKGILPDDLSDRTWRSIASTWRVGKNIRCEQAQRISTDQTKWVRELDKQHEDFFTNKFRKNGAPSFFANRKIQKREMVREVRNRIESSLLEDWKNGELSMWDIDRMLEALIATFTEKITTADNQLVKLPQDEARDLLEAKNIHDRFQNVGWVGRILDDHKKNFELYADVLERVYVTKTQILAWDFARAFLLELRTELTDLKTEVGKSARMISDSIDQFKREIDARCNDSGKLDLTAQLIRFYDPEHVHRLTERFIRDEKEQKLQIASVRTSISNLLPKDNPTFSSFNVRIPAATFVDKLEVGCEQCATLLHDKLERHEKVLGSNIIEKLAEQYGGDAQALRQFTQDLVNYASNFLPFDDNEKIRKGTGIPQASEVGKTVLLNSFIITIPDAPEHKDFVAKLEKAFRDSKPSHIPEITIVSHQNPKKRNEIVLVSVANLFPLRFVSRVGLLKQKYEVRLNAPDKEKAKMILHIEGDGTQHPPLYVEVIRKDKYIPFLMLAKTMDMFQEVTDPNTGLTQMALIEIGEDDREKEPIQLGKVFTKMIDILSFEQLAIIKESVEQKLQNEFLHEQKRQELKTNILALIAQIKVERNNNSMDATFKQYNEAGGVALTELKKR